MTPARLRLEPFRIHLEQPFWSAIGAHTRREGLRLCLEWKGLLGWGEVAPLPGLSQESLAKCRASLSGFARDDLSPWLERLEGVSVSGSSNGWFEATQAMGASLPPSAQFGLETACLDLYSQATGSPAWRLLCQTAERRSAEARTGERLQDPPLAAVLPSNDRSLCLGAAARRHESGVRCFKLKLGPLTMTDVQRDCARALRDVYGENVALRFDSNRSLSEASAASVAAELVGWGAEFLEEPGGHPQRWPLQGCPLALDESLHCCSHAQRLRLLELPQVRFVVLKPALLGGLSPCLRLAARARQLGKPCVVSHCLDGPLGYAACMNLARALGEPVAAGLWPLPHQLHRGDGGR